MNVLGGALFALLLLNDPWSALGPDPTPSPPPPPDVVVIGKLTRTVFPSFGCGYFSLGGLAEYADLRVLRGEYSFDQIFVFHPCPEMPTTACTEQSKAIRAFKIGDYHYLELSRLNFRRLDILWDDGVRHDESMTFEAICAESAQSTGVPPMNLASPSRRPRKGNAVPPNPSLQRTIPGHSPGYCR